jgi:hypothetical protein
MAAKKKAKAKSKSKSKPRTKIPPKKTSARKSVAARSPKKPGKKTPKKTAPKKAAKKRIPAKAPIRTKAVAPPKLAPANPRRDRREVDESLSGVKRSPAQSPDLRGASRAQLANSESVDELLDEGNTFEAGVVSGVEEADDADEQEVHTHEFPEDDVPEEYLDKED